LKLESHSRFNPNPPKIWFQRVQSFWFGVKLPWKSLGIIIRSPQLLLWSTLPVTLTLVLYFYLIRFLQEESQLLLSRLFFQWGLGPETWGAWGIMILSKVALFVVAALSFSFVSSILASPFNDFLAETAEKFSIPPLSTVTSSGITDKVKLVLIDVAKTIAASAAGLIAILMSWVPILNVLAFGVAFLLVAFQYTSYPQTRRGIGIKEGAGFLWEHLWACCGFGAMISFLFAIPFVQSFALPLAVVGGTLLVGRAPGSSEYFRLK
jgi:uncharacterized protein involved in cysteine biosynthesis